MRPVREITAEEENFRTEEVRPGINVIRRDSIEPEPVGTIVLMAFKVTGYDRDCDGSLMARVAKINKNGQTTGWTENAIGFYPESDLVIENLEELQKLFQKVEREERK
jgi:hypothetical protein